MSAQETSMTNETQSNQETIEEKIEDMQHEVGPLLEVCLLYTSRCV